MPHPGESPVARHARLVALLTVVVTVPFVVGTTAPLALRAMVDVPASVALMDAPAPTTEPRTVEPRPGSAEAVGRHPAELLAGPPSPSRPPAAPRQEARISDLPPGRAERALAAPILRPADAGWVARRLEIPSLGIDVAVAMASNAAHEGFPPFDGAYILRSSSQPGRDTNSYLFAHAMPNLFKPLWWASIGQQVIVTMSDGQQMGYRITAIVRDIPCPDPTAPKPAGLPPVLANATECDMRWTLPTASERLTLQTSQGFNRNYGEMVVIAEPDW